VLTTPLLEGTDGVRKMSKSLGNYIGLTEEPHEMFGKLMRVPDELTSKYRSLLTDAPEDPSLTPAEAKRAMAGAVVDALHGEGSGKEAEAAFDRVHRDRELPDDIEAWPIPGETVRDGKVWLPRLLVATGFADSNAEARRLLEQGGVSLGGAPLTDPDAELSVDDLRGKVLQRGRRRFLRLA
jgi:tyrosyl-tRNA synthetase